jgi:hypothetical protein
MADEFRHALLPLVRAGVLFRFLGHFSSISGVEPEFPLLQEEGEG